MCIGGAGKRTSSIKGMRPKCVINPIHTLRKLNSCVTVIVLLCASIALCLRACSAELFINDRAHTHCVEISTSDHVMIKGLLLLLLEQIWQKVGFKGKHCYTFS